MKREAERTVQDRFNNLQEKYRSRIDNRLEIMMTNVEVDRLEAERDTKIAELNKEKEAASEQKLQVAIAAKQKQFCDSQDRIWIIVKNSLYYVMKDSENRRNL